MNWEAIGALGEVLGAVSVSRVGEVELCCEDDVVSPVVLFKCFADNALALIAGVNIGCINKVYASIDSMIDHAKRLWFVAFASKHHGAKANLANLYACSSKWSVFHVVFSSVLAKSRFVPTTIIHSICPKTFRPAVCEDHPISGKPIRLDRHRWVRFLAPV